MEIIIGRNAQTGQLSLNMGTQIKNIGAPNSVPRSVSRRHCRIQVLPNGTYTIENLKMENDTFVNGSPIFTKTVTSSDVVELGGEHYKLDWSAINQLIEQSTPKTADIRPLRRVWMRYEEETNAIQTDLARKNAIRGIAGALGTLSILTMFIPGLGTAPRVILMSIGLLITITMVVISYNDSKKAPVKRKMLQQKLRNNYVCPNCKKFFNMDYDLLTRQYDQCPYCKAKFIK